jgi:hypothetical protein
MKALVESLIVVYKEGLAEVDKCSSINQAKDVLIDMGIFSGLCFASNMLAAESDDLEEFLFKMKSDFPNLEKEHVWKLPFLCSNIEDLKRALENRLDYLLKILPV